MTFNRYKKARFVCYHSTKMMKFVSVIQVILAVVSYYHVIQAKVTVTKFENCDPNANYPIKMMFKLKQGSDGVQVLEEGSLSTKVPLGNDILDIADVSYKEDNGAYEHLITIKENLCDAVNKYMGEFMHDIQEAAGLERGKCPVPPGDYKIKDHVLDFQKFKFKKMPDGEFLAKVSLLDAKTNETLNCHNLEFTVEK